MPTKNEFQDKVQQTSFSILTQLLKAHECAKFLASSMGPRVLSFYTQNLHPAAPKNIRQMLDLFILFISDDDLIALEMLKYGFVDTLTAVQTLYLNDTQITA